MPKFRQQIASDLLYNFIWWGESLAHDMIVLPINICWIRIVCYKVHTASGKPNPVSGNLENKDFQSWKNHGKMQEILAGKKWREVTWK